ncbi:MAG TPA: HAD family hydrolase [Bacillota bacterium]|nr:HAD family hydrolase [Bacillota bacterium]HPT87455.1 HAD family hydrolase [Bacillota bacterium]
MIDTVLFDLDGTLLPLDLDSFSNIYFKEMGYAFQDLIDPETLVKYIWAATRSMIQNTEPKTNEQTFMEHFGQLVGEDLLPVYQERFNQFYDEGFINAQKTVSQSPYILDSINILKAKGYTLVIATNPLFPKKAIDHRIRWAGLSPEDFSYITSYERNHYCKPQLLFYQEILTHINKEPSQCLMVGNDVQEDLIAGKLGIKTFLITDHLIHRNTCEIRSDYQGNYEAFHSFVKSLPQVNKSA